MENLEKRIEELENKIAYEEARLEVCAYGSSDLKYVDSLYAELAELEKELERLEEGEE